jgi:hypothetical protein
MLTTIAISIAFGYWLRDYIETEGNNASCAIYLHNRRMLADIWQAAQAFATVCAWTIQAARAARAYVNVVLIPWLASYGIGLPLIPAIALPAPIDYPWEVEASEE